LSQQAETKRRYDNWGIGSPYERYVGRWSRVVARQFLAWLAVPAGSHWIDVGCGTGALTQMILGLAAPEAITSVDQSLGFARYARQQTPSSRAAFAVADAQRLPFPSALAEAVVSGLVLNFVPDADAAVREMVRVARPGGVISAYVWDYAGEMQFMRFFWDAAVALDPAIAALDEGSRFPLCNPESLAAAFEGAGLDAVTVRPIDIPTVFQDFDDYWTPFLGGQGSAPGYCMSLSEDDRSRLREHIRAALPFAPDGSIHLVARAWAVRGVRQD
jgi:SAM-dependent methyltransferase